MTLFEAIRQLKKGQAICGPLDSDERPIIAWHWGNPQPAGTFSRNMRVELYCDNCRIVDLPKPKMTLEEGIKQIFANPDIADWAFCQLRSLPIDWQAEADRKDNLK
jgi:hypothetical protein